MSKFSSIISDIMSSPVISVDIETTVRDAVMLMNDKRIGSIIVTEFGQAVGIVTERDLLSRVLSTCKDPCKIKVNEIMTSPLFTISKKMSILEAMRKMRDHNIRRLMVMENNEPLGARAMNLTTDLRIL